MFIKRLELENFNRHADSAFDFEPGINMIVGPVGGGKSSIVRALSFALTGDPLTSKADAIRWGQEQGHVKLVFEHNGVEGYIKRSLKTSRVLLEYGDDKITASRVVGEYLSRLFGVSLDMVANWSFAHQGELTKVLLKTPAERDADLQVLFGTSDCNDRRKRVQEFKARIEADLRKPVDSSGALVDQLNAATAERQRYVDEQTAISAKLGTDFMERMNSLAQELAQARNSVQEYNDPVNGYIAVTANIEQRSKALDELRASHSRALLDYNNLKERVDASATAVATAKASLLEADNINKRMERRSNLVLARDGVSTAIQNFTLPPEPSAEDRASVVEYENNINELEHEKRKQEEFINSLSSGGGHCPLCGTYAIVDAQGESVLFENAIQAASERKALYEKNIETARVELNALKQKIQDFETATNKLNELQVELQRLEEQLAALPEETPIDITAAQKVIVEHQQLEAGLANSKMQVDNLNSQIAQSEYDIKMLKERATQLSNLTPLPDVNKLELEWSELNLASQRWSNLAGQISQLDQKVKDLTNRIEVLKEVEQKYEAAQTYHGILTRVADILHRDGYPAAVARLYYGQINAAWNTLLSKFGTDFTVNIALSGDIRVQFAEQSVPFKIASGGQQCALALTFWLVAMRLFTRTGFLVLDEPTYGFDQEVYIPRMSAMLEKVNEYTQAENTQIFLVTHERDLCPAAHKIVVA